MNEWLLVPFDHSFFPFVDGMLVQTAVARRHT